MHSEPYIFKVEHRKLFLKEAEKNEVQMPQQDVIQYIHESHVNITRAFLRQ